MTLSGDRRRALNEEIEKNQRAIKESQKQIERARTALDEPYIVFRKAVMKLSGYTSHWVAESTDKYHSEIRAGVDAVLADAKEKWKIDIKTRDECIAKLEAENARTHAELTEVRSQRNNYRDQVEEQKSALSTSFRDLNQMTKQRDDAITNAKDWKGHRDELQRKVAELEKEREPTEKTVDPDDNLESTVTSLARSSRRIYWTLIGEPEHLQKEASIVSLDAWKTVVRRILDGVVE